MEVDNSHKITTTISRLLGIFWIIDGILQLQPRMFSADFVNNVLTPASLNQPDPLTHLLQFGAHFFQYNIVVTNLCAALIQLIIGILLFFPLSSIWNKLGCNISIVWGVIIWVFGEGLGGILTGNASFYSGAPGSVLVYILITLFILFKNRFSIYKLPFLLGLLFILDAGLQLQNVFWTSDGLQSLFTGAASGQADWLTAPVIGVANTVALNPKIANMVLILLLLGLGTLIIYKPNYISASIIVGFLLIVWWLGQGFGGIFTFLMGTSTDPNTAPVMILLLFPLLMQKVLLSRPQVANTPENL